jgi:putative sigma-54 modulation protein
MNLVRNRLSHHLPVRLSTNTRDVALTDDLRRIVWRRVAAAVDRFADQLAEVLVWVEDINGPRGGADTRCRITLKFKRGGRLTVSAVAANEFAAVARAAERARGRCGRAFQKRRNARRERRREAPAVFGQSL